MSHKRLNKIHMNEINIFRVNLGLRPIIMKETLCIICHKKFESLDYPRERMCEYCRRDSDEYMSFSVGQDLMVG